jgi:uncharacterized protein YndB with AHSA1/START domain
MSVQAAETSVRRSVVVEVPIERAFRVFTEGMPTWWPPDHHLVENFDHMVVETRAGGRIIDVGGQGQTCSWARVLAYEPPKRFAFSWDISLDWQIETDPDKTSEVEITFTPQGDQRTLVELEHRHLDRHGDGWESMRDAVASPNGWDLTAYAAATSAGA